MADHDQIARLEADIEHLAEGLDRCRKAMLFSKVAIAAGGIWILEKSDSRVRRIPVISSRKSTFNRGFSTRTPYTESDVFRQHDSSLPVLLGMAVRRT